MRRLVLLIAVVAILVPPGTSAAAELPPGGTFVDDDGSVHEGAIEAIHAAGVTSGCATVPARFCPDDVVNRESMAAFLARALTLPTFEGAYAFVDTQASPFAAEIDALASAGIAHGCGGGFYCPDRPVTRAEMATFLVRAFVGAGDFDPAPSPFSDTFDSTHREDIDRIALIGITRGCGGDRFCPGDPVTRGEMASFLARALGLEPIVPPPRAEARMLPGFTTFHNCCESRVINIQLMADQLSGMVIQPGEVFSMNDRLGPRLPSDGYVPAAILLDGDLYCCDHPLNIGGGTSQVATTLYNAVFRNGFEIISHRPHSRYINRYPLGIEATLGYPSPDLVFRNDTNTPLTIIASHTPTSITFALLGDDMGRTTSWVVSGAATYSGGGSVTVLRTVLEADGHTRHQTWNWTYLSG